MKSSRTTLDKKMTSEQNPEGPKGASRPFQVPEEQSIVDSAAGGGQRACRSLGEKSSMR